MDSSRLTAFTDGVVAVLITIMVLAMTPPHGAGLQDLKGVLPIFLSYVLSFIYLAIYWNNHHHFFQLVREVNGAVLWANLSLLFWLSLVPFATAWMGENDFAPLPTAIYGVSLLMSALAWAVMQAVIIRQQGEGSPLRQAIGRDLKSKVSPAIYVAGIGLAFVNPIAAWLAYAAVALLWLAPDRRVEAAFRQRREVAPERPPGPGQRG